MRVKGHQTPLARPPIPRHLFFGLALIAVGEAFILHHVPPLTDYYFPLVWFGYIFVVDAAVYLRTGDSLIMNRRGSFYAMLPLSALFWWVFELFNERVQNWFYLGGTSYGFWWDLLNASIDFSTVVPAVFVTRDLLLSFGPFRRMRTRVWPAPPAWLPWAIAAYGIAAVALPLAWPVIFYPLLWGCIVFLVDPLNYLRGQPSVLGLLQTGQAGKVCALAAAGLVCGVFWEFWNFWASPKWFYSVPGVDFLHVFEMPLLGYIGYLPFALELFAMHTLCTTIIPRPGSFGGQSTQEATLLATDS